MNIRDQIVEEAKKYLGVKWQHQGRTTYGIDCAGLIILVGHKLNLLSYDTKEYGRRPNGFSFLEEFRGQMSEKKVNERQNGDVLLFTEVQYPCHVGIYYKDKCETEMLIHSAAYRKKTVEDYLIPSGWLKKAVACFGYRGVE